MIIFISDLHLTDGTFDYKEGSQSTPNDIRHDISEEAFKLFWDDIYRIVKANEKEIKIKEIKLVLLGDIPEMRSKTKWIESDYEPDETRKLKYRPWKENKDGPSKVCKEILKGILDHNEKAFRYLSSKKIDKVEENNGLRRLVEEFDIKINVVYVSGNHDRLINFYKDDSLVKILNEKLDWTVPSAYVGVPQGFKFEDRELGILADHGHKIDPVDFHNDYLSPPIGSLLSDFLGRLMYHVQKEKNKELICFCMDIDNVRPSADRFTWVRSNLHKLSKESLNKLKEILVTCVGELKEDLDDIFESLYPQFEKAAKGMKFYLKIVLEIVSLFTKKKKILKKFIKRMLDKIESRLKKEEGDSLKSLLDALKNVMPEKKMEKGQDIDAPYYDRAHEEISKNGGYTYIVFGHTHRYKLIPFGLNKESQKGNKVFYFNSGTWKRTVQKNLLPRKQKQPEFQKWARMTYVIFFNWKENEIKDHIFDVWHGNLQTLKDV